MLSGDARPPTLVEVQHHVRVLGCSVSKVAGCCPKLGGDEHNFWRGSPTARFEEHSTSLLLVAGLFSYHCATPEAKHLAGALGHHGRCLTLCLGGRLTSCRT